MSASETVNGRAMPDFGSGGWMVGIGFFALAAWFWFGPDLVSLPVQEPVQIDRAAIAIAPMRRVLGDPPRPMVNGFERTCMECHRTFLSATPKATGLLQHADIVLRHGPHNDCLRCHDRTDRDRLRLQDGTTLPYTEVVRLCGECHSGLLRDWQAGSHGRSNGYWDERRGQRRRLLCTECHDPHAPRTPAMNPLQPLPAPHGWRVEPSSHAETPHEGKRDPLREALQRAAEHHRKRKE